MAELGLAEKVSYHAGDCFTEPLPEADVMIFGHVLHDWLIPQRQELLQLACQAVRPGGAVVVYDQMLDEEEPDLHCFIGSLNFVAAQRFPRGTSAVVVSRKQDSNGCPSFWYTDAVRASLPILRAGKEALTALSSRSRQAVGEVVRRHSG